MSNTNIKIQNSQEKLIRIFSDKIESWSNEIQRLDFTRFIGILFILYSCNSYFGLRMFDSQPFPLLLAILFLAIRTTETKARLRIHPLFILLTVLISTGVLLGVAQNFEFRFIFVRGIINYVSIIIFLIAFYEYIKLYGFPIYLIAAVNILWLFIAIVQLFIPNIVDLFVYVRTSAGRGVTSLGPEPTNFGYQLFFLSWIYLMVSNYRPKKPLMILVVINILFIFFIAKSSITILFLFLSFIFFVIVNYKKLFNFKFVLLISLLILLSYLAIIYLLDGTRAYYLFNRLLSGDIHRILELDRSVNSRLTHVILPVLLFIQNMGMPFGLEGFANQVESLDPEITEMFWGNITSNRIMSWNGSLIFELGLFKFLIWGLLYYYLADGSFRRIAEISLLYIILYSTVPLSLPLIPLIFVIMFMTNKYYNNRKTK